MLAISLSCLALLVALVAVFLALKPPQQQHVYTLTERVIACEQAYHAVAARVTKSAKQDNMEKARKVHEARAAEVRSLEEEAAAVLAGAPTHTPPAVDRPALLEGPAARAALRARLIEGGKL